MPLLLWSCLLLLILAKLLSLLRIIAKTSPVDLQHSSSISSLTRQYDKFQDGGQFDFSKVAIWLYGCRSVWFHHIFRQNIAQIGQSVDEL